MTLTRRDLLKASAAASALAELGLPSDGRGVTVVAGVVIETAAGAAPRVAARLLREPSLTLQGGDGDRRLAAVFTGESGAALEALAGRLVRDDADVLGVFPTYVADDPE